jgi:hypothetical protein
LRGQVLVALVESAVAAILLLARPPGRQLIDMFLRIARARTRTETACTEGF